MFITWFLHTIKTISQQLPTWECGHAQQSGCPKTRRNWYRICSHILSPTHPLFSVEPVTLPLDPNVPGNVLSVVPALKMDKSMAMPILITFFTHLIISMNLHLPVHFFLQSTHLSNLGKDAKVKSILGKLFESLTFTPSHTPCKFISYSCCRENCLKYFTMILFKEDIGSFSSFLKPWGWVKWWLMDSLTFTEDP